MHSLNFVEVSYLSDDDVKLQSKKKKTLTTVVIFIYLFIYFPLYYPLTPVF